MKWWIIAGVIIVTLFVATFFFFSNQKEVSCGSLSPLPKVVAFGDSLIEGIGADPQTNLIGNLIQKNNISIKNFGISGNTTAQGRARLPEVLATSPDIVIMLLGGNDALQKVPLAQTQENLSAMIKILKSNGVTVALLGVRGGLPPDPYKNMFEKIAEDEDVFFVSNVLAGVIGKSALMADLIHPNAQGYAMISERVSPELAKACSAFQNQKKR